MVETAVVLPLVVLVFLAGVELFGLGRAQVELLAAVREGARQAATSHDPARAVAAVRAALPAGLSANTRVSVRRPAHVGALARVSAHAEVRMISFLWGGVSVPLRAQATMRTET